MYPEPKSDLSMEFCGVRFETPFILAAAPPTDDIDMVRDAFRLGWAGAVLKTTSVDAARVDLVNPMMSGMDSGAERVVGLGNIDLVSEHRISEVEGRIAALKAEFPDKRVIASISGQERAGWQELARRSVAAGADMIEASFSCPQGSMGLAACAMLGQSAAASAEVAGWIKEAADGAPIIIKLTPQVADIAAVALAVKSAGADAVCVGNTVPALMGIDIIRDSESNSQSPVTSHRSQNFNWVAIPNIEGSSTYSGLSGPAVRPISLRCVAEVARRAQMPIAASGGAVTWRDALGFVLCGASVVQFCTAVMHYGADIIEELREGLALHLDRRGVSALRELAGGALQNMVEHDALRRGIKWRPAIDEDICVRCGRCMVACRDGAHRAISLDEERLPRVDDERCTGCGLCSAICPAICIEMKAQG